jgi:hypothetical protein
MASSLGFAAEAASNPTRYYRRPRQVVQDRRLNRDEKRAILEAWELEARASFDVEQEGPDGELNLVDEVVEARLVLDEQANTHAAPAARRPIADN